MVSSALSSILPRPRHRRAQIVESLYGDRISFLIGGLAIAAAAAITAWRTGDGFVWASAAAIGTMTMVRFAAFELFLANERHADHNPRFWKRLYATLGVLHLALIGLWMAIVFLAALDPFSELLSVVVSMGFLIGTQGRNFSSLSLVRLQFIACLVPPLIAIYTRNAAFSLILTVFVAAFYFAVLRTSRRIQRMLETAIEASEENFRLAHTDNVTGLANRVSMQTTARRAIDEREPFAFLIVDLERFSRVNDTLGQMAGDQLLRQTAETLRTIVGETGLVARGSSDDFWILQLTAHDRRSPRELAEEIAEVLGQPAVINGATMPGGCRIGIACYPGHGASYEAVSHRADMAVFEARSDTGAPIAEFRPGTSDRAADRMRLETDLRRALRDGDIRFHYQPIVSNASLRVVGFEALARWNSANRGAVTPGEFLPVAEDAGLMNELTDQAFRQGCRTAAGWPEHLALSINLSPSQLHRSDLIDMLRDALSGSGLSPERLEIEITETHLLDGRPDIREMLNRIRALGVRLSLDDFGTGYSNLGQIASLPISKIKLDKSFLCGVGKDERRDRLLRGVVQFIAPLGFEIVLEGVETDTQLAFAHGEPSISLLQGYAFSAAMPAEAVADYLQAQDGPHHPHSAAAI